MHIRIRHRTRYLYDRPVRALAQMLRVAPTDSDSQRIRSWRLVAAPMVPVRERIDAFGNRVHEILSDQPLGALDIVVSGEVETRDTGGVLGGVAEPLPAEAFLRETELTRCDASLGVFAREMADGDFGALQILHRTMAAVRSRMTYDTDSTHPATSAEQAWALGRGVCQDLAQVFICVARRLEIPARYVSGHFARADGVVDQDASHAWAEALVPDLGWVGFDPTNGICAGEQHVRVAVALDYLGAAPVRGSRSGGGEEHMSVRLAVEPDRGWQAQQ